MSAHKLERKCKGPRDSCGRIQFYCESLHCNAALDGSVTAVDRMTAVKSIFKFGARVFFVIHFLCTSRRVRNEDLHKTFVLAFLRNRLFVRKQVKARESFKFVLERLQILKRETFKGLHSDVTQSKSSLMTFMNYWSNIQCKIY